MESAGSQIKILLFGGHISVFEQIQGSFLVREKLTIHPEEQINKFIKKENNNFKEVFKDRVSHGLQNHLA